MELFEILKREIEEDHEYVVSLRRYFHKYPELPKKEYNTAKKIEEELDKLGIEHKRVSETGVYAEIIGNKPGKTILLRADIDALPIFEKNECEYKSQNEGVMHACGHDAHAASLLGACRILSKHKDLINGNVIINFQQAEEIGYGARQFINQGLVNGVDRTFGIHVASNIETGYLSLTPGPNNASVDFLQIDIDGKAAHVSTPEAGIDALYIASTLVCEIQGLITRMFSPMDNVLVGIGKIESGNSYNIVSPSAKLEGTIRCLTKETRQKVQKLIIKLAKSKEEIYGCKIKVSYQDFTSPLINDEVSCIEASKVANFIVGDENIIKNRKPSLGGDDMAEYINVAKGCYCFVGSHKKNDSKTGIAHHNEYFDIDEECLKISVSMYTLYTISYLNDNN